MGASCDKKCIRWIKKGKNPRFPFCFIPFWIIAKTMDGKKKSFQQESNKTLAIWTYECLERIAHSIEWEEKDEKIIESMNDEQQTKDIKIQLNRMKRAYYIHNLKWLFCMFVLSESVIEWLFVLFVLFCLLMPFAISLASLWLLIKWSFSIQNALQSSV